MEMCQEKVNGPGYKKPGPIGVGRREIKMQLVVHLNDVNIGPASERTLI